MNTQNVISLLISTFALLISGMTFWFARVFRGTIKMTRPTIICFLGQNGSDNPKLFVRTLLYSTSERGQYVQNMFVKITTNGGLQSFNIWAYGNNNKDIVRGSGLFVNKAGSAFYHHFLLPNELDKFDFSFGDYRIEIFAEVMNKSPKKIFETSLNLTQLQSYDLNNGKAIYYDWISDSQSYIGHSDIKSILESKLQTNL